MNHVFKVDSFCNRSFFFSFLGTVGVGVGSAGFNAEFSRKQRFNLMQDDVPAKNISAKSGKWEGKLEHTSNISERCK